MQTKHVGNDVSLQVDHVKGKQYRAYNIFTIALMSLGSLSYGLSAAVISTTLAQPYFVKYMGLDTRSNGTQLLAATNGLYQAGGFLACLAVPHLADTWGRKRTVLLACAIIFFSGALLAGSAHIGMFIAFRFLNGCGSFLCLMLTPVWMAEVSPPSVRGAMVVMHGVVLGLGYCFSVWMGYAFLRVQNDAAWRVPLAFQCIPPMILFVTAKLVPESPRFLLMQDRADAAAKILNKLHGPEEGAIEFTQINHQVVIDKQLSCNWIGMLKKPSYRKRAWMAALVTGSSQMVGPLVINNYGPAIFGQLGYDIDKQFILQASSIMAGFVTSPVAVWIVDKLPRNVLLGISEYLCLACVFVEAALAATMVPDDNKDGLRAAVAMIFLFFALFNTGVDCSMYAYVSEIFPNHLRMRGMAIAVASINLTNIVLLQAAPTAFKNIGWKWYLCFAFPGLLMASIILFTFPDTCGVPLEEVAAIFGDQDELFHLTTGQMTTGVDEKEHVQAKTGFNEKEHSRAVQSAVEHVE